MNATSIPELRKVITIIVVLLIIAIVIIIPILLIKKLVNKSKKPSHYPSVTPNDCPYISVEYMKSGSLMDDGKCGWLDIESEYGEKETIELSFSKKMPTQFFIPLKVAKHHITYRSKSKAAMAASNALKTINESNSAMGAFANSVFDAGVGRSQLSSVVVDVDANFVMKLRCATNGFEKSCEVVS